MLPRILRKKGYQVLSPEIKQKMLEQVINEAKQAVRKLIVLKANIKDLEDMRLGVEQD